MKIISGGQSGVDRAALDAALARGLAYGGWCPDGGWAEDFPHPPGVLQKYPLLRQTPLADPAQRTEWNVRDTDATLIVVESGGLAVSRGTMLAREFAQKYRKPLLVADLSAADACERAVAWLRALIEAHGRELALGIGGPRESEAPGIYGKARRLIEVILDRVGAD
jgi:Circularly permutated YpsA SLOG family